MTTFDAISLIRRDALSRTQAISFLIAQFGFSVSYACEVINAAFGEEEAAAGNPETESGG